MLLVVWIAGMVIGIIAYHGMDYMHELAHQNVYRYYGLESTIHKSWLGRSYTQPEGMVTPDQAHEIAALNLLNDFAWYNQAVGWSVVISLLGTIAIFVGIKVGVDNGQDTEPDQQDYKPTGICYSSG
jgi:hypothetical protein